MRSPGLSRISQRRTRSVSDKSLVPTQPLSWFFSNSSETHAGQAGLESDAVVVTCSMLASWAATVEGAYTSTLSVENAGAHLPFRSGELGVRRSDTPSRAAANGRHVEFKGRWKA